MTTQVVNEKFELDSPTGSYNEKKEYTEGDTNSQVHIDEEPRLARLSEEFHFTWRSAIVGSLLGCLVGKITHNLFIKKRKKN